MESEPVRVARQRRLQSLNLEGTRLGDTGTIQLCGYLADHPRLSDLNLARNGISSLACKAIASVINDTFYLVTVNLHWNTIR